jgi:outer membrane protein TolC
MVACRGMVRLVVCALLVSLAPAPTLGQGVLGALFREQRRMEIRAPSQLPRARLPAVPAPPTVPHHLEREPLPLSLDEAIRIALANSEVVRVLTGAGATSSGSTIYDPAVANTQIDQARARFDPNVQLQNDFDRIETPQGGFDPADSTRARIEGDRIDQYNLGLGVSKTTVTGGTFGLGVRANPLRSSAEGLPLNPRATSSVDLSFTQPLLQGAGIRPNVAPIEIAQIDTERSFYQLKGSVQQLVRGVIEAYWALVFARVDVWARQQQEDQGEWAFDFADGRLRSGLGDAGERAQAQSSFARFHANRITAEANLLRREAALRNILGLPPSDAKELVPVTPPTTERINVEWGEILRIAETYRPDLIERKLRIEADQQELLLAHNDAFPRVDASALYRWDALGGRDPSGAWVTSRPGQFTGWQFGIDVSLPLGLRQSRAALRQRELSLIRDRANLDQALHNATHLLAENCRNLAQFYAEYEAFKETRQAARINLDAQFARWMNDLTIYLNVLEGVTSWGDAIDAEAQALLEYNSELANLQEQTGTILEVHGVRFVEEPYRSIGPMGRGFAGRWYPRDSGPAFYEDQYERGKEPAEYTFELDEPVIRRRRDLDRRTRPPRRPDRDSGRWPQLPPDVELQLRPVPSPPPERIPVPEAERQPK